VGDQQRHAQMDVFAPDCQQPFMISIAIGMVIANVGGATKQTKQVIARFDPDHSSAGRNNLSNGRASNSRRAGDSRDRTFPYSGSTEI